MAINTTQFPLRSGQPRTATTRRATQAARPSDDEILGLTTTVARPEAIPAAPQIGKVSTHRSALALPHENGRIAAMPHAASAHGTPPSKSEAGLSDGTGTDAQQTAADSQSSFAPTAEIAQILDAHPQLRAAWDTAQQFQSVFATPAAAQDAKAQLDELDEMFFAADPSAQAALAARIHELSPEAFHSLAQAMQAHATQIDKQNSAAPSTHKQDDNAVADHVSSSGTFAPSVPSALSQAPGQGRPESASDSVSAPPNAAPAHSRNANPAVQNSAELQNSAAHAAQVAFFHSTNSAAVHQVLAAIESQVTHLLPASVSAMTKTRIVGEIYRDLGSALSSNRQLGHQLRQAFRSGAGDIAHQRAIVALVAGRARQALPSIARRVINEWTHDVVGANQEKLSRQSASAKRVDISGAASSDGVNRRPVSPRELNYKRLSDADILNL